MRYKSPKTDNQDQYVPIVAKSKDWLIGYLSGFKLMKELMEGSLAEHGIDVNLKGIDLCLDSSRFNDIMENGKRESTCSKLELEEHFGNIIKEKLEVIKNDHPENEGVFDDCFLEAECVCGLGIYTFKTPAEVPEKQFRCGICGKVVIDYTDHYDEEIDFEGNLIKRNKIMAQKLNEEMEKDQEDEDGTEEED
jgi:hypothetical protein